MNGRLPLTTLGFLQYVGPTMQLLTAVFVFGETFGRTQAVGFGLIWAALALVALDSLVASRRVVAPMPPRDSVVAAPSAP